MVSDPSTSLRFSRRAGEATRDGDYACSIEGPEAGPRPLDALLLAGIVALSVLAGVLLVL